ncbi:hypothetical protein D9M69_184190 [compost metagenome]
MPVAQFADQGIDFPVLGNPQPAAQGIRRVAEQVFAKLFTHQRLAAGEQFALDFHQLAGVAVVDPAAGHFRQQRRGHPAVDPQDALGAQRQPPRHRQVADAQAGEHALGEAGAVEGQLRRVVADRRRAAVVEQRAVDVVLDDVHAVAPGDLGDLAATRIGHQRRGGVVQVRRAHQRGDPLVGAEVLEVFRVDALAVDVDALEGEAEHLGIADHAVVAELFAEHHVVRAGEGGEGEEDAVGGAIGDQQVVALDVQPQSRQPLHGGLAVALEAGDRPAHAHPRLLALLRQFAAGFLPQAVVLGAVDDPRHGEIHQGALGIVEHEARHPLGHAPRDETAAAHLAAHQALALQLLVGVGHRLHADAEAVGDLALRRQALAVGERALFDVAADRLHQCLVFRFAVSQPGQRLAPGFHDRALLQQHADRVKQ